MSEDEDLRRVVRVTVQETFLALGLPIQTPDQVIEAQAGFSLLRSLVKLRMAFLVSLLSLAGSGVGWAIWTAVTLAKAKSGAP
jgi:hypothetical protein